MTRKNVLAVLGVLLAFAFVAMCGYQEYMHIDLNSKQVWALYWKERIAGFVVVLLVTAGMILEKE